MSLAAALRAARKLTDRVSSEPLRHVQWTPPQRAFHQQQSKRKLFRAGNQIGKTWAVLAEAIWIASKTHPYQAPRPGPLEIWIICTSWSQSVAIMRKFHQLCPRHLINDRASSNFSVRSGYGKDNPAVVFVDGTIIRFRTTNQGPEALQGSTVHHVVIDEPTSIDIYRELDRRVMRTGGTVSISATPANRDCTWMREMVEDGSILEVHAKLTVANLTPEGEREPLRLLDGTLMDQAWIDEQWRLTPALFAPVVLDGEWDMRPEGVFFDLFDPAIHVNGQARLDPARGEIRLQLGIDYAAAAREYGQTAALLQVQQSIDEHGRKREAVLMLDEVVMPGVATNRAFADKLVAMLSRHGLNWRDLYQPHGDNPVVSRWVQKSNIETMKAIAKRLGIGPNALQPRIRSAKEGRQSSGMVDAGCRYLYAAMADQLFVVHPRCVLTIEAIQTWDYDAHHPAKDRIDAIRYALKPWIFPSGRARGGQLLVG